MSQQQQQQSRQQKQRADGGRNKEYMYVCIVVALCGDAHGIGHSNWAKGGTHPDRRSNIPTPRYHRYRVTHAGSYLCTQRAFSQPTLIWAAKGDLSCLRAAR